MTADKEVNVHDIVHSVAPNVLEITHENIKALK